MNDQNVISGEILSEMKVKFMTKMENAERCQNSFYITASQYKKIILEVEAAKESRHKTTLQYRRLKRYDIIQIGDTKKLISPVNEKSSSIRYFVTNEDLFDVIHSVHSQCGHSGRDIMLKALAEKYANITREAVVCYLDLCTVCHKKRKHPKKGLTVKPLLFRDINERGQVDLIDMQTCNDGEFKYILNYQDHLSKYSILRPLKSKSAAEVAYTIVDIFCTFGAPSVLQADNGKEFSNCVINELKELWPGLNIVHGKPRHSQSQGSVERSNQDVQKMVFSWMEENKTNKWSEGLRFCQLRKNTVYHSGIKQTPFEAMFGRKAHIGLQSVPNTFRNVFQMEEEVQQAFGLNDEEIDVQSEECHQTVDIISSQFSNFISFPLDSPTSDSAVQNINVPELIVVDADIEIVNMAEADGKRSFGVDNTSVTVEKGDISHMDETETSSSNINDGHTVMVKAKQRFHNPETAPYSISASKKYCCVCSTETSEENECNACHKYVHAICGQSGSHTDTYRSIVLCFLCANKEAMVSNRRKAHEALHIQGNKMKSLSNKKFKPIEIETSVTVPIPSVDRSKGDARNVLGVVMDKSNDGFYKIGTEKGVIKSLYSRNQIQLCKDTFVNVNEVPKQDVSLRQISNQNSSFGGQGFIKCNCHKKCVTNSCKCRKEKLNCNSKCHHSTSCTNK